MRGKSLDRQIGESGDCTKIPCPRSLLQSCSPEILTRCSFARKPTPPRDPVYNGFNIPIVPPSHPTHHRSHSHGATSSFPGPPSTSTFPMDLPRWDSTEQLQPVMSTSPFGVGHPGFQIDPSWLPISPNSLLHPQPGEADSSSEDSPMGRWAWMAGMDDLFDPGVPSQPGSNGPIVPPSEEPRHNSLPFDLSQFDPAAVNRRMSTIVKCQRIEDIAPFSTITKILQAYHAHL